MDLCARCGKEIRKPERGVGAGYGVLDGRKYCYPCCGEVEKEWLLTDDKSVLYLTGNEVINWCGTLRIPCTTRHGRHNIAGTRTDCWFKLEGKYFHGVQYGSFSELCHIKRVKPWEKIQ